MTNLSVRRGRLQVRTPSARAIPAHFTVQQRTFVEAVRDTTQHLVLRATAGSGKTTTLAEAAWHLDASRRTVYFAYNKHSVMDVGPRLPPRVWASTLHAYGRRLLCQARNAQLDVDEDKSLRLAGLVYEGERVERRLVRAAGRLWDLAREYGLGAGAHEDDLTALAVSAEWPEEQGVPAMRRVLAGFRQLSLRDWQKGGLPDFTDFLWLPLELGLGSGILGAALVDEAQDLTPLRQQVVLHLLGLRDDTAAIPGRLIAVGDPEQAIYTYAGADPCGLWRLAERLKAQELPLSVSFRCPSAHVALARNASSFIQAAPKAQVGTVEHLPAETATFARGDVILSRLNAPLIRMALSLMTREVSVNIRGRDLAARLETATQEAFPQPFTGDEVRDRVNVVYERRAKPLTNRVKEGDLAAKKALGELKDLCACLRLLATRATKLAGGWADVAAVSAVLQGLYHEDADVLLSTVHRAKGLEWERVTVLYPELMPSPHGDPEEERCVLFVCLTRSKGVLRLAYGKEAWANGWRLKPGPEVTPPVTVEAEVLWHPVIEAVAGRKNAPALPVVEEMSMPVGLEDGGTQSPGVVEPAAPVAVASPVLPIRPREMPRPDREQAALVAHAQRVRASQVPAVVEDGRPLALFGGSDVLGVVALRERLDVLLDESRPALREWATGSLTLLRTVLSTTVQLELPVLLRVERAANRARLAVPLMQPLTKKQVALVVFTESIARLRPAELKRRGDRAWRVLWQGEERVFDPRTGELLGTLFTPEALHLHLDEVNRGGRS
ncbi:ATP-dependent helicase [Deinococcus sp. Arct2-2]|uniref:UvrD-helicase domain-containing protein n=1 Tax=Deinococcus sp. Arct2-2 TaxID=2568653 RepID=UPI0010A42CA9|nr:UvrD-helicase domain-containing protein [Deinococcus sp. Arct2-2]THF68537.1 ATP-dependent helicase [Deinococcus sp. Arct2-2]